MLIHHSSTEYYKPEIILSLELWTEILDCGIPVKAIYLDFWKVFDAIPHPEAEQKPAAYRVTSTLLKGISVFL